MLSGDQIVYLLQELPDTLLVSNVRVGSRLPAHVTAPGRVLLAALPPQERRSLLGRGPLSAATRHTPTTHADLDRLIGEDARRGCAWSFSGYEKGVDACAAPVFDRFGKVAAAISVAGPDSRFDEAMRARTAEAVTDAARLLSKMLGHRGEGERPGQGAPY